MRICFIANYSKTYLFDAIAKHLKLINIDVCWIVVNRKLYHYLLENYGADNVLYLDRSYSNKQSAAVDDFCINELIYGDRVLRYTMNHAVAYLTNIQLPIQDFITNKKINIFFGEHTWAHELVIKRMANRLGINYLDPQVARIPNGRFGFFYGESHEHLFKIAEDKPLNGIEVFGVQRPTYLNLNNSILAQQRSVKSRLNKAKRFITNENIDKADPTIISDQLLRFRLRVQLEINKEAYYLVKRCSFNEVKHTDYVFHTLHMQPESTIDVFGRYYENQYQMILNLWRKLPLGWKLVVKEHTNAIGDRPYSFYNKVAKLPNVYFVDERTNSHDLISKAKLVVTVAGTVAYEAALMQVPAVIFSKAFFCRLSGCSHKTLKELALCNTLKDWLQEFDSRTDNRKEFCQFIQDNTFEGIMTDPVSDPSVLDEDNIKKLVSAFVTVINKSDLKPHAPSPQYVKG